MDRVIARIAGGCSAAALVAAAAAPADAAPGRVTTLKVQVTTKARPFRSVPCAWSFLGDPRSLEHGSRLLTGCVTRRGTITVDRYDLVTGAESVVTLARGAEEDDHNNPSLVFFRRRLYVFWSPHSGYRFPLDRRFYVRYRVSRGNWGAGGFGPVRRVPLPRGCGLGYTYPNPAVSRGRLYLFLRGPCWDPIFTTTANGLRWTAAKTLLVAPSRHTKHRVRPYAKYADAPDGSIHVAVTDGHPYEVPTGLYYVRLWHGRFYRANGRVVGRLRRLPLRFGQIDRIASPSGGRAWSQDIAVDHGRPVIVYSTTARRGDVYRYAWWTGTHWRKRPIVRAGRGIPGYGNAGIAIDHDNPSWIALVRSDGRANVVELLHTPDHGDHWQRAAIVRRSRQTDLRPVFPRGSTGSRSLIVLYIAGTYHSYRSFQTVVRVRVLPR